MTMSGGRSPLLDESRISRQNSQKVPLRSALMPRCQPARDKSWHGNDAQAMSAPVGTASASIFPTSPKTNSSAPKLASYASCFLRSMSFAQMHDQVGSKPSHTSPAPAKKSRKVSGLELPTAIDQLLSWLRKLFAMPAWCRSLVNTDLSRQALSNRYVNATRVAARTSKYSSRFS